MISFVILYSQKKGELNKFLSKFYNTDLEIYDTLEWKKEYKNPIEATDLIGVYADNFDNFLINMWLCLDKDFYINITKNNVEDVIRYIYERYPY